MSDLWPRRREVFLTQSFFTDERWVSVTAEARLFALGLWSCADQCGVFPWSLEALSEALTPGWNVGSLLDELADSGLVTRGGDFGCVAAVDKTLRRSGRYIGPRPLGSAWQATRRQILDRDGERCRYCETEVGPFEVDHIHPVSRGGDSEHGNLCVACQPCNRAKGDKLLSEWTR